MKLYLNNREQENCARKERNCPKPPVPPHLRKNLLDIELDTLDMELLQKIFGDEDTTAAAVHIIKEAPPEIQIIILQLMVILGKEA
ncbi:hypothetical protein [Candidatus Allofournierella excrementavium]|uniref:hypothetical protein n=1 Tax=Candidatus Allofournierella excrementavium TaxID=2838591 RepID=UPI00374E5CC8